MRKATSSRKNIRLDEETERLVNELTTADETGKVKYGELADLIRTAIAKEYRIQNGQAVYVDLVTDPKLADQFAFLRANNRPLDAAGMIKKLIGNEHMTLSDSRSTRDLMNQVREMTELVLRTLNVPADTIAAAVQSGTDFASGTGRTKGGEGK